MKSIYRLIICLFSIFNNPLKGQDKIVDSFDILKNELQQKISNFQFINNDQFYRLINYAKTSEKNAKIINAYYTAGRYYLRNSESEINKGSTFTIRIPEV